MPGSCSAGPEVPKPDLRAALVIGERVYLREPSIADEQEIIARNRASRPLHRGWVTPPTDQEAFAEWMKRAAGPASKALLVCRLEDGAIAGVFMVSQIVRRFFQNAYLGYYGHRPFDGQGYMTEGMQLVLRHAFRAMKLHRLEANVQPENVASIALVKRSGFRLEGYSPRYLKIAGRWRDHQRWAILIDDWQRLRRQPHGPSRDRAPQSRPASWSRDTPRSG